METIQRYALVLFLMDNLYSKGSWCGETHIQKNMYILETLYMVPSEMGFILYKHGPYSFDLHDILGDMMQLGFIEQEPCPPYGPRMRLTGKGREFLEKYNINTNMYNDHVITIAEKFKNYSVQSLEKVATALLLRQEIPSSTVEERANKLHNIKKHISIEAALEATKEVENMLITT